jgi:hypothetical protein
MSILKSLTAEKIKYEFKITILDLKGFSEGFKSKKVESDEEIQVNKIIILKKVLWKRGTSRSGHTDQILVKNNILNWNNSFVITGTIQKEKKSSKFFKKILNLTLQSVLIKL